MRKIENKDENPIDNVLIDLCELVSPYFKYWNWTPNHITMLRLLLSIIAIILIVNNNFMGGALLFFVSYFFDCLDGNMARKYKMYSKFGDIFDHIVDLFVNITVIVLVLLKIRNDRIRVLYVVVILVLLLLMNIAMGCQEKIWDDSKKDKQDEYLSFLKKMCYRKEWIKWTRFFGSGTFIIAVTISILLLKCQK